MYNSNMTLAEIMANPKTREVLVKYFGEEFLTNPMVESAKGMTIEGIRPHAVGMIPDELFLAVENELKQLK